MSEDIYWRKYAARFRTVSSLIRSDKIPGVEAVVCIPVYGEPDIITTLESLSNNTPANSIVEVILLFNKNSLMSDEERTVHEEAWRDCNEWINQNPNSSFFFLPVYVENMPDPKGGVGWARKLAMDEAARRLDQNGIIICLDADCKVSENYLVEILSHFKSKKEPDAASIYFEHTLDDLTPQDRKQIADYELHLRYLVDAQRWCGHPFAFHTVGSSIAVRRGAYLSQGGMNTRRAGEDFYFLQKFIETGNHSEINSTAVFPSARSSNRVPFGTGKAMQQMRSDGQSWLTTDFEIFKLIRPLFNSLDMLKGMFIANQNLPDYATLKNHLKLGNEVIQYFESINFLSEIDSILKHTAGFDSFRKRFFRYFNAFKMIKYMHYMRDQHFPDVPVKDAVTKLFTEMSWSITQKADSETYLKRIRQIDRRESKNLT